MKNSFSSKNVFLMDPVWLKASIDVRLSDWLVGWLVVCPLKSCVQNLIKDN